MLVGRERGQVADRFAQAVERVGDVVEKFIVLLDATSATDAGELIETARARLVERRLKLRENDKPLGTVSFSAGVASSRSRPPAASRHYQSGRGIGSGSEGPRSEHGRDGECRDRPIALRRPPRAASAAL